MHLLIPFASGASEAGREALGMLALPRLAALISRLHADAPDAGDESSLSPPHERALARELGFSGGDGLLPFAAHRAALDGVDTGERAWGLLSPAHWDVGTDRVSLADPLQLGLDEAESRALLAAVAPLFDQDGFVLAWGAPHRWYAAHDSLDGLATASLDRVVGRNVDRWLPGAPAARTLRRLQSEVQMLLHTHPLNAQREARGQRPVNSFWLSGCGRRQPPRATDGLVIADELRGPALAEDWPAWRDAWQRLDSGPVADALVRLERGEPVALTLAGERSAQRFDGAGRGGLLQRLATRWRGVDARTVLEAL